MTRFSKRFLASICNVSLGSSLGHSPRKLELYARPSGEQMGSFSECPIAPSAIGRPTSLLTEIFQLPLVDEFGGTSRPLWLQCCLDGGIRCILGPSGIATETFYLVGRVFRTAYGIHVLDRAVSILDSLEQSSVEFGVSELTTRVGLQRSTVHRLLSVLGGHGYVAQSDGTGKYRLGCQFSETDRNVTTFPDRVEG